MSVVEVGQQNVDFVYRISLHVNLHRRARKPILVSVGSQTNKPGRATKRSGFERIFVWVGSLEAADRACELACALARPGAAEIMLGLANVHAASGVERLATTLARQGLDVRVTVLADCSLQTLATALHRRDYDLLLHADRERRAAPSAGQLSALCDVPVWLFRAPRDKRLRAGKPLPLSRETAA